MRYKVFVLKKSQGFRQIILVTALVSDQKSLETPAVIAPAYAKLTF